MKILTKATMGKSSQFMQKALSHAMNEIANPHTELNSYEGYQEELFDAIKEGELVLAASILSILAQAK